MALVLHLDFEILPVGLFAGDLCAVCDWCDNRGWLIDKSDYVRMIACFDHVWNFMTSQPDQTAWR